MPLPLIPIILGGGSAILVYKGSKDCIDARARIKEAKRRYTKTRHAYENEQRKYSESGRSLESALKKLGEEKLRGLRLLGEAADFLEQDAVQEGGDQRDQLHRQQIRQWKQASDAASDWLAGAAAGGAGGVLTAAGAYGLVGIFGSASTGTAISTLTGIAAKNATMAWFGGGAIAAGGGGIVTGACILGGLVAGPALYVFGSWLKSSADDVERRVRKDSLAMNVAMKEIRERRREVHGAIMRVHKLRKKIAWTSQSLREQLRAPDRAIEQNVIRIRETALQLAALIDTGPLDGN